MIGPFTPMRSSWYFISRVRFLKETRKRSARSGPASLSRLFLKWSLSSVCLLPSLSWITRYAISPRKIAFSCLFLLLLPKCGRKFLSRAVSAFCRRYSSTCPCATRFPMNNIASLGVSTPIAFSNEGPSMVCKFLSRDTASAMSLSFSMSNARIMTTKGISVGTPGIVTYMAPSDFSLSSILALKPTVVENILA